MRQIISRTYFTLIFICAVAFASGSVNAQKFGKITDEEWNLQAPDDYPEANALVIFDKAEIVVTVDGIEINRHLRIKILTQAGAEEVGDQSIFFYNKGEKIKRLKAHTITPDGKKHKVEKNSMFIKKAGPWREKTMAFPMVEVGSIIELQYKHYSKRLRYLKPWYFQGRVYTLHSEVSVEIAPGFNYNVSYQNVPYMDRNPRTEERRSTDHALASGVIIKKFTWDMENLPPIKDEPYMSSENDYRSNLRFQLLTYDYRSVYVKFVDGWDELGDEFHDRIKEYCNKKKEIKKLAHEATKGITDLREQSQALYDHVSQQYKTIYDYNTRYYFHKKIDGLLTEKTGTPEGKNVLLAKMHQALDIPCWPVLISRRSHSRLNPKNPNLLQFDYLLTIVEFDDGWEFLDASDRFSPYGILPPECLTSGGLLIDGDNSQLIKMTVKPTISYRLDKTNLYISDEGEVSCSTECLLTGYTAALYAQRYEKEEEDDFIEDYFIDRLGISCETGDYECGLDSNYDFRVTLDFTSDDLVEQLDDNLIIQPVSFVYRSNPFESKKRFFPVDFNYPFTYHNIVNIFLDNPVSEVSLPEDLDIVIDGATFVRQSTVSDTMLTIAFKLDITEPMFLPVQYRGIKRLFGRMAEATEDKVVVVLKSTSAGD